MFICHHQRPFFDPGKSLLSERKCNVMLWSPAVRLSMSSVPPAHHLKGHWRVEYHRTNTLDAENKHLSPHLEWSAEFRSYSAGRWTVQIWPPSPQHHHSTIHLIWNAHKAFILSNKCIQDLIRSSSMGSEVSWVFNSDVLVEKSKETKWHEWKREVILQHAVLSLSGECCLCSFYPSVALLLMRSFFIQGLVPLRLRTGLWR